VEKEVDKTMSRKDCAHTRLKDRIMSELRKNPNALFKNMFCIQCQTMLKIEAQGTVISKAVQEIKDEDKRMQERADKNKEEYKNEMPMLQ